jgi:hypothetical protein
MLEQGDQQGVRLNCRWLLGSSNPPKVATIEERADIKKPRGKSFWVFLGVCSV